MMIDTPVTICFVIPQNRYRLNKNHLTTSMMPGCVGNIEVNCCPPGSSRYLLTSRDAIWTNPVQVFCVEV